MTLKSAVYVPSLFGTEFIVGVGQFQKQRTGGQLHPIG